jgi:hypothetical protein
LPRSSDALLDKSATQVGIYDTTFGPADGLLQACIRNPFAPSKFHQPLGFENSQSIAL